MAADFNIRSESVDVEQIMKQIRSRISEKRGADYTEEQIRELASVRLEKFLDPKNLRSDLLEQFRKSRPALPEQLEVEPFKEPPPVEAPYTFDDQTLFRSHRASLRWLRKMFRPIFKLFWNPNTLNQVLHTQAQFNVDMLKRDLRRRVEFDQGFQELKRQGIAFERSRAEWNVLYYEVLHNLVLETTRTGIEVKNLKMRVEALASRLDFSERRVRALEGVVQYRPEIVRPRERDRGRDRDRPPRQESETVPPESAEALAPAAVESTPASQPGAPPSPGLPGDATARRRRRRRRGRRNPGAPQAGAPLAGTQPADTDASGDEEFDGPEEFDGGDLGPGDAADSSEAAAEAPASDRQHSGEAEPDEGAPAERPRDDDRPDPATDPHEQ